MRAMQTSPAHHERGGILINFVIDKLKWGEKDAVPKLAGAALKAGYSEKWRVWTLSLMVLV